MGLFRRKVTLEDKLVKLATFGCVVNEGVGEDELFMFHDREALEAGSYKDLVETLAQSIEEEPCTPICDRLWLCDHEGHGDYVAVVERLERLTGGALGLEEIQDHVHEDGTWVSFVCAGEAVRWELAFDSDWMDAQVLGLYAELVASQGGALRCTWAPTRRCCWLRSSRPW